MPISAQTLTLRDNKGSALTHVEMDTNFRFLSYKVDLYNSAPFTVQDSLSIAQSLLNDGAEFQSHEASYVTYSSRFHVVELISNAIGGGCQLFHTNYDVASNPQFFFFQLVNDDTSVLELDYEIDDNGGHHYILDIPNGASFYVAFENNYHETLPVTLLLPYMN